MNPPKPHFLLFCEGNQSSAEVSTAVALASQNGCAARSRNNRWKFVLENVESGERFHATDQEFECSPDRASLVAALRGLEALEQPSKVTLLTNSRYVFRGLRYGLAEWRENDYSWEHFGAVQPIRNSDLWRRIDHALAIHEVQCRWLAMQDESARSLETDSEITSAPATTNKFAADEDYDASPRTDESTEKATMPLANILIANNVTTSDASHSAPLPTRSCTAVRVDSSHQIFKNTSPQVGQEPSRQDLPSCVAMHTNVKVAPLPSESCPTGQNKRGADEASAETGKRPTFRTLLFYPFALCWSLCKRSILAVWETILHLDEGVESYLRCMLLMDPKHYRKRRQS